MKHREILSQEENAAVNKFQEYNANVQISYGSKANWSELVHNPSLYSDELLASKVTALRSKFNSQQTAEDEDGVTVATPEFAVYNGMGDKVEFSTEETLLFVRAARKVRKHMATLIANKAEIAKLEATVAKLKAKTTTPEQALAEAMAKLAEMKGEKKQEETKSQDPV